MTCDVKCLYVKSDSFVCSFPISICFYFFFLPAMLARASKKILKRSSHPCLITDRKENAFTISLLHMIFMVDTLYQIREGSLFFHFNISLMNEYGYFECFFFVY